MAGYGGGKILTHARLPSVTLYQSALLVHHQLEMVGLSRFELLTPRLSSVCSNQLSYRPSSGQLLQPASPRTCQRTGPRNATLRSGQHGPIPSKLDRRAASLLTPCEYQIDLRSSNSRGIRKL